MTEDSQVLSRKKSPGMGIKIAIGIILILVALVLACLLTLNVTVMSTTPGVSMPFSTDYGVSFPEGQTVAIGNTHISVLSYQNELTSDIDGDRQTLVVGDNRVISERRALITTLGIIPLIDTHFRIDLQYKGERDNRAYFDMTVYTSAQVPDTLLMHILPGAIDARPGRTSSF